MVEFIIILCVVGIILIKLSDYKITIHKNITEAKSGKDNSQKKGKRVGRVGKSMPDLRQMMTLNDSSLESDNPQEKEYIFDSSKDESEPDPKDLVIDADPTEVIIDEEDETEDIVAYTGGEIYTAGGMDYDVMMDTVEVINSKTATKEAEQRAGKVLYDNRGTELVDKMISAKKELSVRIVSLIGLRLQQHAEGNPEYVESGFASHLNESDEYKNFKADDYF